MRFKQVRKVGIEFYPQFDRRLGVVLNFHAVVKRCFPQKLCATNSDATARKIDSDNDAFVADCQTYQCRAFVIDPQREPRKKPCVTAIDTTFW
jgi:hypothetical protein